MRVDVHQHLWPDGLIRALERRSEPPRLRGTRLELSREPPADVDLAVHDVGRRLELLDRDEIDVAIVSPAPTLELEANEDLQDAWHESAVALSDDSGGRLLALSLGERRDGFRGVCVSAGRLEAGLDPLLRGLEATGELLFVHPGPPARPPADAPRWWSALADYTAQMQSAYLTWLARDASRFRDVPVVFSMLAGGAPIQLERLATRGVETRNALHPNVYFDAASYGRRALELCLATFGVTQLLYGSDAPVIEPRWTLEAVGSFGEAVAELVLCENPKRVLRGGKPT
jgi:hypothetical protein